MPSEYDPPLPITTASKSDLEAILALQKEAYLSEAEIYDDRNIPPLLQTLDDIHSEFDTMLFLKIEGAGEIIGSVRAYEENGICHVGKLIVSPKHQNKGLGSALLRHVETMFPNARAFELFTGNKSDKNLYIYTKAGYTVRDRKAISDSWSMVILRKDNV